MSRKVVPFSDLKTANLFIDAIYEGGCKGNASDDAIDPLLGVGNQGGFRFTGSALSKVDLCVLYTDLSDSDWPDQLFVETGRFIYFGDNKRPGHELHDTPRRGNLVLRQTFENAHGGNREAVPPFFVFTKGDKGRDVIFRGLAVPGAPGVGKTDDLVAIWRTASGQRFQNYRATFTILDTPPLTRDWIERVRSGHNVTIGAPKAWLNWRNSQVFSPLVAPGPRHRTPVQQYPVDPAHQQLLEELFQHYKAHPDGAYAFEKCAAEIVRLMDGKVASLNLTRPWRDGGRDGVGQYEIGPPSLPLLVDFALEAKCWKPGGKGCGVDETSRLISRLRHRQFGVFVTTAHVADQAYKEIVEDSHPVLILAGIDIVNVLIASGIAASGDLKSWLSAIDANATR